MAHQNILKQETHTLVPIWFLFLPLLPSSFRIAPQRSTLPDLGHGLQTSFRLHTPCETATPKFPHARLTADVMTILALLVFHIVDLLLQNSSFDRLQVCTLVYVSESRLLVYKELTNSGVRPSSKTRHEFNFLPSVALTPACRHC